MKLKKDKNIESGFFRGKVENQKIIVFDEIVGRELRTESNVIMTK